MNKPRVFIGSSTGSLVLARSLAQLLKGCIEPRVWKDRFKPGRVTFETVMNESRENEFAIFIFSPDDIVRPISKQRSTPRNYRRVRDNVVFEAGLFLGRLGRNRTLILAEETASLLTDFRGLTTFQYAWEGRRTRQNALKALSKPAEEIHEWIERFALHGEGFRNIVEASWKIPDLVLQPYHDENRCLRLNLLKGIFEDTASEMEHTMGFKLKGHESERIPGPAKYERDIGESRSYLTRASPLFAAADQVYAVSLDLASRFWLAPDERQRKMVEKYQEEQRGKPVHRLFVFTNARSAAEHRWVLRDHFDAYGSQGETRGGVYLCSFAEYQKFRNSLLGNQQRYREPTDSDFALLTFNSDCRDKRQLCFASLGEGRFTFEEITDGDTYWQRLFGQLNELARLEPGEQHQNFRILRWKANYSSQEFAWQQALHNIFQPRRPDGVPEDEWRPSEDGDVLHLMFLRGEEGSNLGKHLTRLSSQLRRLYGNRQEKLVRDIWFGRSTDALRTMEVYDGRFRGKMEVTSQHVLDFPYCLMIHINGLEMLKLYYEHPDHSDVRREILTAISPGKFGPLYQKIEYGSPSEQAVGYSEIEKAAMEFMFRADYIRDEDLKTLIELVRDPRA